MSNLKSNKNCGERIYDGNLTRQIDTERSAMNFILKPGINLSSPGGETAGHKSFQEK